MRPVISKKSSASGAKGAGGSAEAPTAPELVNSYQNDVTAVLISKNNSSWHNSEALNLWGGGGLVNLTDVNYFY